MMQFSPVNHQLYRIVSGLDPNKCLDCSQNPKALNKLILYKYNGGPNQKWAIRTVENGKYAFFCSLNNGTLQVPQSTSSKGAKMEVNQPNNAPNEKWDLIPTKNPKFKDQQAYHIKAFNGQYLDVCEGKTSNDTPIIQYDFNGEPNQIWIIQPI